MKMIIQLLIFAINIFVYVESAGNPFLGQEFHISPSYQQNLMSSILTSDGKVRTNLEKMYDVASGFWVDKIGEHQYCNSLLFSGKLILTFR